MADSFEDPVFGRLGISSDDPRYRDWVAVCRRAEEEDAELRARLLTGDPRDAQVYLDFFSKSFDIRAKGLMVFAPPSYDGMKHFEELLAALSKKLLSVFANMQCPDSLQRLHVELRLRIAQRSAHWKHQALRSAREAESKAGEPHLDALRPTTVEPDVPSDREERASGTTMVGGSRLAEWLAVEMKKRNHMTINRLHVLGDLDRKTIKKILNGKKVREAFRSKLAKGCYKTADDRPTKTGRPRPGGWPNDQSRLRTPRRLRAATAHRPRRQWASLPGRATLLV